MRKDKNMPVGKIPEKEEETNGNLCEDCGGSIPH